jgi:hypothetical protein
VSTVPGGHLNFGVFVLGSGDVVRMGGIDVR